MYDYTYKKWGKIDKIDLHENYDQFFAHLCKYLCIKIIIYFIQSSKIQVRLFYITFIVQ